MAAFKKDPTRYEELSPCNIQLVMSYTTDYTIGTICEQVNRAYASKHGYSFYSDILSCEDMLPKIAPKLHFTWYKVLILLNLMQEYLLNPSNHIKYLFWIDGDALIIKSDISVETIIHEANYKELIIAEDMHTGCFINAGVFILKVCDWNLTLFQEIWTSTKFDKIFFYEQSALTMILRKRKEHFEWRKPFHSYVKDGPQGIKYFPHVAVYPHTTLSTNICISKKELEAYMSQPQTITSNEFEPFEPDQTPFIYHAAGLRHKLEYIKSSVIKYIHGDDNNYSQNKQNETIRSIDLSVASFRLRRNRLGHYLGPRLIPNSISSSSQENDQTIDENTNEIDVLSEEF